MGEMVEFRSNGSTCGGYLARPHSGGGPGVIVIQEWWGLVPHIQDICDRLAVEGFVALAPDLYHGEKTTEPDDAGKLLMGMRIEQAAKDMAGAVDYLLGDGGATGPAVGVVGFCMGGGLALFLAALKEEVTACVPFYGMGPGVQNLDPSKHRADVLAHWATEDTYSTREGVAELEQKLRDAGWPVESFWYEADHAFFNDQRPEVYNADAAQQSWERTLAFFRAKLTETA